MLIGSLVELHAWLHSYLCFSCLEKLFLSNLDSFSTLPRHLAIYRAFQLPLFTISIASRQLGGSIKISFGSSIASRQLVDRSRFFFSLLLNCPSIASSVDAFFLDTSICRDLLGSYLSANRDFPLIFLDLSLDRLVFSPPKTLSLTPNFTLKRFSSFLKYFLHLVSF